jgi:hypothetical protein
LWGEAIDGAGGVEQEFGSAGSGNRETGEPR